MKTKELMIGDWILAHCTYPAKITEIKANGSICTNLDGRAIDETDFVPIQLTSEILELNGFSEGIESFTIQATADAKFWIQICEKFEDCLVLVLDVANVRLCLTYVHQLQHALRLCGLSELADNFKIE